ncbi:MAG TPA: GNAT family N-acetyltransferase [Polyangia bacterium]|nr:GNAT family N-acetyltransferase [Polyangia bacterium]
MPIPDAIRRFAEEPEPHIKEAPPPTRRVTRPSHVLILSPSPNQAIVSAVRTTEAELDATIADVRAELRQSSFTGCVWTIGPSCRPTNLRELLVARGFRPATRPPFEAVTTAMALAVPPPPARGGAEARVVKDFDEYVQALRIALAAFGESEEESAAWIAAAPKLWEHSRAARKTLLGFVDGEPVGFAFVVPTDAGIILGGSGVLEGFRGRGVYRALVDARWKIAVELGTPALTIHAGAMSRPILERCGFETICEVEQLDDVVFWNEQQPGVKLSA